MGLYYRDPAHTEILDLEQMNSADTNASVVS
jgi:hypothetical protein